MDEYQKLDTKIAATQFDLDLLKQELIRLRGSTATQLTLLNSQGGPQEGLEGEEGQMGPPGPAGAAGADGKTGPPGAQGQEAEEADTFPEGRNTPAGANLTNSVTAGGSLGVIADITDQIVYANDAAAIRNNIYQLARLVKLGV